MKKILSVIAILSLVFSPATPAFAEEQDIGAGSPVVTGNSIYFSEAATATVADNVNLAAGGGVNVPVAQSAEANSNGATITFAGTSTVAAALGGAGDAITLVTLSGDGETVSIGGDSFVTTTTFAAGATATTTLSLASGVDLTGLISVTDAVDGTVTLAGGTQAISGIVGAADHLVADINAGAEGGQATFSSAVTASNLDITSTGTVILNATSSIATVDFETGASAASLLQLNSGVGLTGLISVTDPADGTVTLVGGVQAISGTVGSSGHLVSTINAGANLAASSFTSAVYASVLNVSGTGGVTLNTSSEIAEVNFSADGTLTLGSGDSLTGAVEGAGGTDSRGTLTLSGGTQTVSGLVGTDADHQLKIVNAGADSATSTFSSNVFAETFNVTGDGTVAMNGDFTGTLDFDNLTAGTGTFQLAAGKDITGAVTNTTSNEGRLTLGSDSAVSGAVGNTDAGLNRITVSGGNATIGGNTRATDYYLAGNTLSIDGTVRVGDGATVSINTSDTATGNITATGDATLSGNFTVDANVTGALASGVAKTVINSAGGTNGRTITVTDNSWRYTFTGENGTAGRVTITPTAVSSTTLTTNGNASAVAQVLNDSAATATGDFLTVQDALTNLGSATEFNSAVETMTPDVSSAAMEASRSGTNAVLGSVSTRLGYARNGWSGVSTGDMFQGAGFWMQGLGSHIKQDTRKGIEGYKANMWGTSIGMDQLYDEHVRLGLAGGYGWARAKSKTPGSPSDDINSFSATIYGSYDSVNLCEARQGGKYSKEAVRNQIADEWYVDSMFNFTQNNYDSRREIWVTPATKRIAKAEHYGQQYTSKLESGYTFAFEETKSLEMTPFASLQYSYMRMNEYKEKGADSLNLKVNGEGYHQLLQALGAKFAYPITSKKAGTFIPSIKAAWLFDYLADRFETTAKFGGGGAAFTTKGAEPARNGLLLGGELAFLNKGNMTLTGNYDLELKDEFWGQTYYGTVRFDF